MDRHLREILVAHSPQDVHLGITENPCYRDELGGSQRLTANAEHVMLKKGISQIPLVLSSQALIRAEPGNFLKMKPYRCSEITFQA